MYLRNSLIYNNVLYFLECLYSIKCKISDFLGEIDGFTDVYEEMATIPSGCYTWKLLSIRLFERMFKIDKMIKTEVRMDFIEATKKAQNGQKMRRKEWLPGGSSAWHGKEVYVWWDKKYKCLLAAGPYVPIGGQSKFKDTEGYTYVCEGNDIESSDWEKAEAC